MEQILKVIKAEYMHDYVLSLTFSNGVVKKVDFLPMAQKGICVKLRDKDYLHRLTKPFISQFD